MTTLSNCPLVSGAFFVLRTPSLPYAAIEALRSGSDDSSVILRELANPLIREAIYLSSQSLYRECYAADGEPREAAQLAALRYLYRAAARCTPFGVLAGITTGEIASETRLVIAPTEDARRFCRLDQGVLQDNLDRIKQRIVGADDLDDGIMVSLNQSAWKAPDGIRYVSPRTHDGFTAYSLSRMRQTPVVDAVIAILGHRPMQLRALIDEIARDFEADEAVIVSFVRQLIQAQVLVIEPNIYASGDNDARKLLAELDREPFLGAGAAALEAASRLLGDIGSDPIANIAVYGSVTEMLASGSQTSNPAKVTHVDLFKDGLTPTLAEATVAAITEDVWKVRELICRPGTSLTKFAQAFSDKFGDEAVPLLRALDVDYGVGFGTNSKHPQPLLGGFPYAQQAGGTAQATRSKFDAVIARKLHAAMWEHSREILIDDADLKDIGYSADCAFPSAFSLLGSFHDLDPADPQRFQFEAISFYAPSAVSLFSRFCVGSPDLTDHVRRFIAEHEAEQGGAIVAEFVHLPEGRIGNVVLRPVLRDHEIPYLGRSASPEDCQHPPADLLVSVRNGRVVLYSEALGREVVPRITTAHNHTGPTSLPLYQFMGALQRQGENAVGWVWPTTLQPMPFLPRVRCGRLILARARWSVPPDRLAPIGEAADEQKAMGAIDDLMAAIALPPGVRSKRADNFIDFDLSAPRDRRMFAEECRRARARGLILEETFTGTQWVEDSEGRRFEHEVILPLASRATQTAVERGQRTGRTCASAPPGGHYTYARIFAGPQLADRLIETLIPRLDAVTGAAPRICFFIRYWENGAHLRLRIRGDNPAQAAGDRNQLDRLLQDMADRGYLNRWEYATYLPEFDRYGGGEMMELCERIFTADSMAVVRALHAFAAHSDREDLRWRFAAASLSTMADAAGANQSQKLALYEAMLAAYSAEFSVDEARKQWLNDLYRRHKREVDALFLPDAPPTPFAAILETRDAQIAALVQDAGLGWERLAPVMPSLMHMTANRIFPENGRAHELALFNLLTKGLRAAVARFGPDDAGRRG